MRTEAVIVSTDGCHLCDEAERAVRAMGAEVRVIDIFSPEGREVVRTHRTALVPIIVADGRLVSSGHFDRAEVERALSEESA